VDVMMSERERWAGLTKNFVVGFSLIILVIYIVGTLLQ
jgi:hypothetical protein